VGCGMAHSLTDGHDDRIAGVLLCYDRLLITGTVSVICYAEGMTRFLYANGVRIFDYPQFASSWAGAHHLGHGSLRQPSAVARQGERQDLRVVRQRQMPARCFYFIDAALGLIYLRVPTWCPFRLQFYCNGHGWLGYSMADNAVLRIDNLGRAQELADTFSPEQLHRILDHHAVRAVLPLEPDAGGIRHRPGVPVHHNAWAAV
jgi:hypothetical protein